jgi:hypothetical protein
MHEANPGTALLGPNYARRSRAEPTKDNAPRSRWIAIDESGWDGDQLTGTRRHRYMTLGSVAIDDVEAAEVVAQLRHDAGISDQAGELKFKHFGGKADTRRRRVLADALGPGGALESRASVYVIDKHYFVAGKIIDLFLEPQAHATGQDMYRNGDARQAARTLFEEGPRALTPAGFDKLLSSMVDFASMRNRTGQQASVEDLFTAIDAAWTRSTRRRVTDVLAQIRGTRAEAADYLKDLQEGKLANSLEPLIPCVAACIHNRSMELGQLDVLLDDQRTLTDDWLDTVADQLRGGGVPELRWVLARAKVGTVVRGESRVHPSLQLADLVAGAGFTVVRRHDGDTTQAAEELYRAVVPIVDPASFLPHDDPKRLAVTRQG